MKYVENGYIEIKKGVFVKTYEPYDDGVAATEKQKYAIYNMLSFLKSGDEENHNVLSKKERARVQRLTEVQAMKEISKLIEDVKHNEDEMLDAWADTPF